MAFSRKLQAFIVRFQAAQRAFWRQHPSHRSNAEENRYIFDSTDETPQRRKGQRSLIANYTKGLPHDADDGLIFDPKHYEPFVKGIDSGSSTDFFATPLGPPPNGVSPGESPTWASQFTGDVNVRAWESQAAGLVFDLEGPDAQTVTMPPAPTLNSEELISEVAEVYEMALLRDVPFANFEAELTAPLARLNQLAWFNGETLPNLPPDAQTRRRGLQDIQTVFRGIARGDDQGPYLSQFLCRGTSELGLDGDGAEAGFVQYGALVFQNRVRLATPRKDYMTTWEWWLDVQNGADLRGRETYEGAASTDRYRFIATPRDLATYVHYDALYEAYLNACLALLALGIGFDRGIPFQADDREDHQQGFAHWGGPHILSLVTEVATRALKAVRYQKFNIHRRLRPEAVGGRIHRWKTSSLSQLSPVESLSNRLSEIGLLDLVQQHNANQNTQHSDGREQDKSASEALYLLPMAFPEGSPMHPAYGAGHATVAGACVTILKAFFDHTAELPPPYVQPSADGRSLQRIEDVGPLTVEGELNKLAANISIGRNWAGVHYFTDYYESVLMGEQIALGILEEQMLTFREDVTMTVPSFDKRFVEKITKTDLAVSRTRETI
ncbi:vanadium-dependent haloperoxidase [Acaryochloris marina NIES-2412]|uniref:vanadium-dependent haloperoxidase n=1 Tax=Acaryochloris marina TaxID=155978 RepID=UPI0040591B57